ncbi:hypothetical protein TTHERM_00678160 (macronuclear) [Tetrahymena thermophila SB210]|uniref:Uncharacterized protein n=1 Tax=Tetrahymena thermophila (strain SB210) TaxID=312017 RepID=I7MMZ0_TETTS|nr:hypothetical protein TTHERM_00678160 [Tetrahymena thermophila SB210]EAS07550.1 hypothetical protein TTHERM_00678160 [Tetrahymena thermophila SB210]|eukprot:XP_001027792.1 hypothetical protein TTHERM_00678160 [Tetrahymena thermophila SB210]
MDLNNSEQLNQLNPSDIQWDFSQQYLNFDVLIHEQPQLNKSAENEKHYIIVNLSDTIQKSAHNFCPKEQQNHPPFSFDQMSTIREAAVYHAIENIEDLGFNNLEVSEHCIYLLSQLIPYTAPNFKEYSNYIIAFAINQACFPEANMKNPSDLARFIKYNPNHSSEESSYFQCYSIYMMKVPHFPSLELDPVDAKKQFECFDMIHSYLQGLLLLNQYELTERLKQENTSFSHMLKIIQTVDELTDNDFTAIYNCIKIYWLHEELFDNYSSEIIAHVILKLLQYSSEVEFNFSKFGNLELLSNIYSQEWIENFKNCFVNFIKIIKTQIPQEIQSQCCLSSQDALFDFEQIDQYTSSFYDMEIEQNDDQSIKQKQIIEQENFSNIKLNMNQNQIQISNNLSIKNTPQNYNEEFNQQLFSSYNQIIKTPEKKTSNLKLNDDISSLSTDPQNRQLKFLNSYTEETNKSSSSTNNLSMSVEDAKNLLTQELTCKISPTPFNQPEISTFQHYSEIKN